MTLKSYDAVKAFVIQRRWQHAIAVAREVGNEALSQRNFVLARNLGGLLERLNDHRSAAHLLSVSLRELQEPLPVPEWDGSSLSGRTLVVLSRNMHVGPVIRYGRLLALASQDTKHCIALVERRLLPLFRRSFANVDVREAGREDDKAFGQADVAAGYETLVEFLGVHSDGGIVPLSPLTADENLVAGFRAKYSDGKPLIGVCWHSTNANKDLPTLREWAEFLQAANVTAVSLQYGDSGTDLQILRELSGVPVIYDDVVDSLQNLDAFAAQIAALDAVVTISNTGAHMAGALDVPMFVLLDDKDHLLWPFVGRTSDWYRGAVLYRKAGRRWSDVFKEVVTDMQSQSEPNEI